MRTVKELSVTLHDRIMYQDLLRLAINAAKEDNSCETKSYPKSVFKAFAKGYEEGYVEKFQQVNKLFEEKV